MGRFSFLSRPPLVVFLLLVLASCVAGFAIINFATGVHTSADRKDYFTLTTKYVEVDFPKSWYAGKGEEGNESRGSSFITYFVPTPLRVVIYFRTYDQKATQFFMEENNITSEYSIGAFEIAQIYNVSKEGNSSSTLSVIDNRTITVSGRTACSTTVGITNALEDNDVFYNITGTFISLIDHQSSGDMITQIIFYGEENDWDNVQETFLIVLDSSKLL